MSFMTPHSWGKRKLTPKQWDEIRRRRDAGESTADLSREFGVAAQTIYVRLGARP